MDVMTADLAHSSLSIEYSDETHDHLVVTTDSSQSVDGSLTNRESSAICHVPKQNGYPPGDQLVASDASLSPLSSLNSQTDITENPTCSSRQVRAASANESQSISHPAVSNIHHISRFTVQTCYDRIPGSASAIYSNAPSDLTSANGSDLTGTSVIISDKTVELENKSKKKVYFPEGTALIKGCAHAPNPWYNVSLCSTENLVHSYLDSCSRHAVKPHPKLLNQINCISTFGERINLLMLKGENLSLRQVETLEEIFRRVQFTTIDLENTHLDDEAAIAVFDMVEYYESAINLRISQNRTLGIRSWLACARMIRKTPCLESLEVKSCVLGDHGVAALGRSLRMGAYISVIHLEDCNLACKGIMIIAAALRTSPTIKELYLGDNSLQSSDGTQLGNLLRDNVFIRVLDVKNNNLQDVGMAHICDGIAQQPAGMGVKTLNLTNNHITTNGMMALSTTLARTKTLDTLVLSQNNITNEGVFVLKEGLLKNKTLSRLSLASTKLSCEGAVALAEYIADSYSLAQLDLRDNEIKTAGLIALSMCIRVHQTVTRLELDQNPKKEQAMKDYQTQQRFFLDEIQLQLQKNADKEREKVKKLLDQHSMLVQKEALEKLKSESGSPRADTSDAAVEPPLSTPSETPLVPGQQYMDPLGAVPVSTSSTVNTTQAPIGSQDSISCSQSEVRNVIQPDDSLESPPSGQTSRNNVGEPDPLDVSDDVFGPFPATDVGNSLGAGLTQKDTSLVIEKMTLNSPSGLIQGSVKLDQSSADDEVIGTPSGPAWSIEDVAPSSLKELCKQMLIQSDELLSSPNPTSGETHVEPDDDLGNETVHTPGWSVEDVAPPSLKELCTGALDHSRDPSSTSPPIE